MEKKQTTQAPAPAPEVDGATTTADTTTATTENAPSVETLEILQDAACNALNALTAKLHAAGYKVYNVISLLGIALKADNTEAGLTFTPRDLTEAANYRRDTTEAEGDSDSQITTTAIPGDSDKKTTYINSPAKPPRIVNTSYKKTNETEATK